MNKELDGMSGLYIHIPFCLSKCPYCDFYSVKYENSLAKAYKEAVKRNLLHYGGAFDTVYFGGGTPILLWREICELLGAVKFSSDAEITVEANPCCTDKERLSELRGAGVNRISFGVQSLDDNELRNLGRRHNVDTAVEAVRTAYDCGYENISADLMIGTEGQTLKGVEKTLQRLSKLPITHISVYMLKVEEGTPFAKRKLKLPDEEAVCEIYLGTVEKLKELGFGQYEISNFAKKGFECKHNLKYWSREEYLGIGPAAHSFYKGQRFFVERDLSQFIASQYQEINMEDNGNWEAAQEYAMLRLRLSEGLSLKELQKRGGDARAFAEQIKTVPDKYIRFDGDTVALTAEGYLVSNAIIGTLLGF